MRKPVLSRILLLLLFYSFVFVVVALIQFSGKGQSAPAGTIGNTAFAPRDFTIPEAQTGRDYNAALSRWRTDNFNLWSQTTPEGIDEDLVISLAGESLNRSAYAATISTIPAAFLNGSQRTYESSVYLGRLEQAARMMITLEQEKLDSLTRRIQDQSPDLLRESGVFGFLAARGYNSELESAAAAAVGSINAEPLDPELVPGIFEGYTEWNNFRSFGENPFGPLIPAAAQVVSELIMMNSEKTKVFIARENRINTEFNLRLGKALAGWAESERNEDWLALGRSVILSVLSLTDSGLIQVEYLAGPEGEISGDPASPALGTPRFYRVLDPEEYKPRAVPLGVPAGNTWTWTAAQSASASMENNILDLNVSFPAGETHYMIIRGIRPFRKIQLYGVDFRTDPQFERYDSSGWSYIQATETLLLKMKHRNASEHVVIYYQ